MIYTVSCHNSHPSDLPGFGTSWWDKQHEMNADELALICRGMRMQGWRCEVICDCHSRAEETLLKRIMEVIGEPN